MDYFGFSSVSIGKASSMKTDNPNRSMILKDIFPRELDFDLKFSLEVIFLEYGFGIASKFWLTVFYRKSFLDKQFRELGNRLTFDGMFKHYGLCSAGEGNQRTSGIFFLQHPVFFLL